MLICVVLAIIGWKMFAKTKSADIATSVPLVQ